MIKFLNNQLTSKKDARYRLLMIIKKLFINYMYKHLIENKLQFMVNVYLRNTKMNEECCCCMEAYKHIDDFVIVCTTCNCSYHYECAITAIKHIGIMKCAQCRRNGKICDITSILFINDYERSANN